MIGSRDQQRVALVHSEHEMAQISAAAGQQSSASRGRHEQLDQSSPTEDPLATSTSE